MLEFCVYFGKRMSTGMNAYVLTKQYATHSGDVEDLLRTQCR